MANNTSVSLSDHQNDLVSRLIASGRYASASEIIREGLRLVEEKEEVRALRIRLLEAEIEKGLDSGASKAGPETMEKLLNRYRSKVLNTEVE